MAATASTRIARLQAISPRYSTVGVGLGTTINYSTVAGTPTSLGDINTTEGSKLSGIAAGATVGATWGSNLASIPGFLSTPAGAGLYSSSSHFGFYDGSGWKTYMDNSGNFALAGTGTHGLTWTASTSTLSIRGNLNASDITGGTMSAGNFNSNGYVQAWGASSYALPWSGTSYSASVLGRTASVGYVGTLGVSDSSGGGKGVAGLAYKGVGVYGEAALTMSGGSFGVWGKAPDYGVYGESSAGYGVLGEAIHASAVGLAAKSYGAGLAFYCVGPSIFTGNINASGRDITASTFSGTATYASMVSNSGHTYTFSGGVVTGSNAATFSGLTPGVAGGNGWVLMTIDGGGQYWIPAWPNV